MKHKNLIVIPLLIMLAACAPENPSDISVRLPIPTMDAAFVPFFAALDQGYYAEEGLNVTFEFGSSETNPVKMVAAGGDEFGILGGPDTLLVARSRGQPLVAIALLHKDSDFPVLLTLNGSGLTRLEDLEGKRIGFFYGHISTDVLHALLNRYNITREEIDVGFDYTQLATGRIDAQWAFRTTAGLNLPAKGIAVNVISPSDYGIRTHGYTVFTTEEMTRNHPDVVERFVRATLKGAEFSLREPDAALASILVRDPRLDPALERERIMLYNDVMNPAGTMDHAAFAETYERLLEEGVLAQEFDVREAYTTEFLG